MVLPGSPQSYIEVSVEIPRNLSDAVCNFIIDNMCSGLVLEEEDDSDFICIKFYLPANARNDLDQRLSTYFSSLIAMGENLTVMPRILEKPVKSVEWEQQYRDSVKPLLIAGDVCVRPPWEPCLRGSLYDIVIEPKMAFGTGSHESTRSCLQAIREHFKPEMRFLDLGCGSGILSILADKMGARFIKAVDYDLLAVENCGENFLVNNVQAEHNLIHGSIDACQNDEPYEFICVNIIKSTILEMLDELKRLTPKDGYLILAGLLEPDVPEIHKRLTLLGLEQCRVFGDNEWRTFVIRGA